MHNNYYFLRQLSSELAERLRGFSVVSCFSQSKDELVLEFNNTKTSFFLRGNFSSAFCCLSFPGNFSRARKNSIDLFPEIILKKIIGIRQYENERSFSVELEDGLHLLFKMHGNRANVVLISGDAPVSIFRNHLKADLELRLNALDRTINWSKEFFIDHSGTIAKEYFTFGKQVWNWLEEQGFGDAAIEQRWELLRQTKEILDRPDYFICKVHSRLTFLLFPMGETIRKFTEPLPAVTEFYFSSSATDAYQQEKNTAMNSLTAKAAAGENYLLKSRGKLEEVASDNHYQAWADLIMANLHLIKPGMEKITVENFYDNNLPVDIKLKNTLSPQKNAEAYYRKSKNQHIEIQKLKEAIALKEKELEGVQAKIKLLEGETELKGLRQKMEASGIKQKKDEKQPELLPYREFEFKGYRIWVGRNAESNDKLTLKYSYKEDLWLHAKDVAGSHVLVKHQSGKIFPKDVIEHAAGLAAYFSKRKNESLCPVAYTFKKHVRKRKGDPAGTVVVEREQVILVKPLANS